MPLDFVPSVLVSTVLTGALSALAYRRDVLTWDGSLAAFVVGMVIGIFGDVTWLFLLLFFLLSSFLATRYRFALKEALGVQEGVRGERKSTNVLANGFAPMAVAAISLTMPASFPKIISGVIFLSALSVAGADTLASEIGVLSRKTVLITTGEPVPPGTDGGVSRLGQPCAFGAAAYPVRAFPRERFRPFRGPALRVHTEDRLGARWPHEDGAIRFDNLHAVRGIDFPALREFDQGREDRVPSLDRDGNIRFLQMILRKRGCQRGQSLAFVGEELEHLRGGHRAVAAELMIREDDAAVLLAAERGAGLEHRPGDDRRTHAGPDDTPACGAHDVIDQARRADGRPDGPATALDRGLRQEGQTLIAVDEGSFVVHNDRAVRIAIVVDPEIRVDLGDDAHEIAEMIGNRLRHAAGKRAVRLPVEGNHAASEGPQQVRRHDAARAVPGVDDDRERTLADRGDVHFREDRLEVLMVRPVVGTDGPDLGPGGHVERAIEEDRFNRLLVLAAHFHAAGVERLDPVELPRVVGGRHDDASFEVARLREEVLLGRRRHDAQVDHVAAGRHQAGRGRAREHRTAEARVAAQDHGPAAERRANRSAYFQREIRVHLGTDDPANPVRAEQPRHALTRSSKIVAYGGTWTPSPMMLSRLWAPSPTDAPVPIIDAEIFALSATLTASRRAAFVTEARPILHDFPQTT